MKKILLTVMLLSMAQIGFAKGAVVETDITVRCFAYSKPWYKLGPAHFVSFSPWEIRTDWGTFRWDSVAVTPLHAVGDNMQVTLDRYKGTLLVTRDNVTVFDGSCDEVARPTRKF